MVTNPPRNKEGKISVQVPKYQSTLKIRICTAQNKWIESRKPQIQSGLEPNNGFSKLKEEVVHLRVQ